MADQLGSGLHTEAVLCSQAARLALDQPGAQFNKARVLDWLRDSFLLGSHRGSAVRVQARADLRTDALLFLTHIPALHRYADRLGRPSNPPFSLVCSDSDLEMLATGVCGCELIPLCVQADKDHEFGYDETAGKMGEINSALSFWMELDLCFSLWDAVPPCYLPFILWCLSDVWLWGVFHVPLEI